MNNKKIDEIDEKIEGSMLISLLNRIYKLDMISNSTYMHLKKKISAEYRLNLA